MIANEVSESSFMLDMRASLARSCRGWRELEDS